MAQQTSLLRKTLTVDQVAEVLGISRSSAYAAVNSGQISAIRIGRRLIVPVACLEELLEESQPDMDVSSRAGI
jgi:excisionase family DNA binding protein